MSRKLSLCLIAGALAALAPHAAAAQYAYDDGVSSVLLGPPDSFSVYGDIDMLWGNYFFTGNGGAATEDVTSVSFGLGDLSPGGNVSIWIFDDPDNDADPTNAVPIFSTTTVAQNLGFDFNVLNITPTTVTGGFFVAVGHLAELTTDAEGAPDYPAPARFDPDGRADRSWFFYDSDIPENDLGSSGFVQRMDGPYVPIPGAFAIRATTIPAPGIMGTGAMIGLLGIKRRRR